MSKQQSYMPEERQVGKSGRKRKGKYELWMRGLTEPTWIKDWWKVRSYETLEMAEYNKEQMNRKWNSTKNLRWEFEVRINN